MRTLTDDQRFGDLVEHAARALEYARALGGDAAPHRARAETRARMARDALLQCLAIVGLAASGVSTARRARYPGIPWGRVIALRRLSGTPDRSIDFEHVRRALREVLPALLEEVGR